MTDDASPENLRKFLESDDPALVRMGISMAKGAGMEVTVTDLVRFLKSEDVETIKMGFTLAEEAGVGDEAMDMLCEPLNETLSDENGNVRQEAVKVLGNIGDKRAVEPLIKALKDKDFRRGPHHNLVAQMSRAAIASALGNIGDERAVEPLIDILKDRTVFTYPLQPGVERVRFNAVEALGRIGDARAVEPLIKALGDVLGSSVGIKTLRKSAAIALGEIGDARAVEPLIKILEDESRWVDRRIRDAAKEALKKLGHEVE